MNQLSQAFQTPSRQSSAAIFFILWKFLRSAGRYLVPILILYIFRGTPSEDSGEGGRFYLYLFFGLGVIQVIASLISYWNYFFFVQGEELVIKKGFLNKTRLSIPFDRIQTVNLNQSLLHQFLNVFSVEIDTAGSAASELNLSALSKDKAEALRDYVLAQKALLIAQPETEAEGGEGQADELVSEPATENRLMFQRKLQDLIKVGATQNHLQTAGLILGFGLGLLNYVDDILGWEEGDWIEMGIDLLGLQSDQYFLFWIIAIPLLLVVAFLLSLVRAVIRYYNLSFFQTKRGFKVVAGLFERREQSAVHSKIQRVRWTQNPLQKMLGYFTLRLFQASSAVVNRKQAITLPGAQEADIDQVLSLQFPGDDFDHFEPRTISRSLVHRNMLFFGLIPVPILLGAFFSWAGWWSLAWLAWPLLLFPLVSRYQHRYRWSITEEMLKVKSGVIGTRFQILPLYKIQSVRDRKSVV